MSIRHAIKYVRIRKVLTNRRERQHFVSLCIKNQSVWHTHVARAHPLTALRVAAAAMRYSVGKRHELSLGTEVMFQGERWYAANGYRNPDCMRWLICKVGDRDTSLKVREDELEIVRTPSNLKRNALGLYRWWSESWSSMDIRDVLDGRRPASLRILGLRSPLAGSRYDKDFPREGEEGE